MKHNFILILLIVSQALLSQPFYLNDQKQNQPAIENEKYGRVIDASVQHVFVGVAKHQQSKGKVDVYTKQECQTWQKSQEIEGLHHKPGDRFGHALSSYHTSLAVGAPNHGCDYQGSNCTGNSGAVYVYNFTNTWGLAQKISPIHADVQAFGSQVYLFENILLIRAETQALEALVYIYEKNAANQWVEVQILEASTFSAGIDFGRSLLANKQGLFIGDNTLYNSATHRGSVFYFQHIGNAYQLTQTLTAPDSSESFGFALAFSDQTLYVSDPKANINPQGQILQKAGQVHVFQNIGSAFVFDQSIHRDTPKTNDGFGFSIDANQSYLVVGAPEAKNKTKPIPSKYNAGMSFIFDAQKGFAQVQKLFHPRSKRNHAQDFGYAITLNSSELFIGDPGHGQHIPQFKDAVGEVYFYNLCDSIPPPYSAYNFALEYEFCEGETLSLQADLCNPSCEILYTEASSAHSDLLTIHESYTISPSHSTDILAYTYVNDQCISAEALVFQLHKNEIQPAVLEHTHYQACVSEELVLQAQAPSAQTEILWFSAPLNQGAFLGSGPTLSYTFTQNDTLYVYAVQESCTSKATEVYVHQAEYQVVTGQAFYEVCAGQSLTLEAQSNDGDIQWFDQPDTSLGAFATGSSIVVSPLANAVYYAYATQTNCLQQPLVVKVTVKKSPQPPKGQDLYQVCSESSVDLTAYARRNEQVYWFLDTLSLDDPVHVGSNFTSSANQDICYYVYSYDGGCYSSEYLEVCIDVLDAPQIPETADDYIEICAGSAVTLTATGTNLEWYSDAGLSDQIGLGDSISVSPGANTVYYVVSTSECGNSQAEEIEVALLPLPDQPLVDQDYVEICTGSAVTLTATGTNLEWYSDAGLSDQIGLGDSISVNPDASTTYYVVSTSECGNSQSEEIEVVLLPLPEAPEITDDYVEICTGSAVTLTATGTNLEWYSDAGLSDQIGSGDSISVSPDVSTTYYVVSVNECGVSEALEIEVVPIAIDAEIIDANQDASDNLSFNFDANYSSDITQVTWYFDDGNTSTDLYPSHTYTDCGNYQVVLQAENEIGCVAYDTLEIDIAFFVGEIPNIFTPNDDGVNDEFCIETSCLTNYNLTIYNFFGNVVFDSFLSNECWDGTDYLFGSQMPDGVYYYVLNSNEFSTTGTVTLMR